jgi:L-asparaginase
MFELVLISNAVNEALAESDTTGCVVTHGTFTAEETACFLHYTVNSDKPVVVAASQRRHSSMGNDGDWNLVDAVRVATHPDAKGRGAMLVMNEEIMSSREVTKTNQRPGGFASSGGSASALGSVESDQVTFYFRPERKHTLWSDVRANGPLPAVMPRVDIVKTYAGADEVPIAALIDRSLKERSTPDAPQKHGIVVEGFAYDGKPHQFQMPILQAAMYQHGIPVAVANRGDHGRVPKLVDNPFISCDNLMAVKARLLLILALEKLGALTPFANVDNPSSEDRARLEQELSRYQEIFDTH